MQQSAFVQASDNFNMELIEIFFNKSKVMKKATFRYAELSRSRDKEIVFATYVPHLEITLEVAQELVENRIQFAEGHPHYILIDFTNVKSVSKEARDFMNSSEGGLKGILGGAFLSNNVVATMFINLFLKIRKPNIPARFFTNRHDALDWLEGIKSEKFHYTKMISI